MKYELIIIGGGAGGFAGALQANDFKIKTLIVNSDLPLGGTCVNVGCVPSKFLIEIGKLLHYAQEERFKSLFLEVKNFAFNEAIEEELLLVSDLRKEKYENVLSNLENVEFIEGKAKFISEKEILVNDKVFEGEKFLLAVGSRAFIPPIENLDKINYLTHETILKIRELPKRLIILGAGPIGLEFGQVFKRFGSEVTIFEANEKFLPFTDPEIASKLYEIFKKERIEIYLKAKVKKIVLENNQKFLEVEIEGKMEKFLFDEILIATGKRANTKDLGLEKVKVEIDEKGSIKVDEYLKTSNPQIYAVGDCNNLPLRLETTAAHEGTIAVGNMFQENKKAIDYNSVPFTIFTDPSVSGIGYTEERQIKEIGACSCRVLDFKNVPRALIEKREGLIKMLINPKTKEITGIHLISPDSENIISQGIWLLRNKITIDEVIESLPVFPSLSEAIKLVALSFYKDVSKLSCCI